MAKWIAGCVMVALAGPALADDMTSVTPVFGRIVAYTLPEGFTPAFEDSNGSFYIQEAVRQGETVDAWTQMITMTGAQGRVEGEPMGSVIGYANAFSGQYADACPDSFQAFPYDVGQIAGSEATFAALIGCGGPVNGGPGEAAVVVFAASGPTAYTLQWAERFDASGGARRLDPAEWRPRLDALLARARFCEPVAGEAAPYPSCVE